MKKRPIDQSKKSNIKCEHCNYFSRKGKVNCANPESKHFLKPRNYWNMCKGFKWRIDKEYINMGGSNV